MGGDDIGVVGQLYSHGQPEVGRCFAPGHQEMSITETAAAFLCITKKKKKK